jgi:hypothetical protein
MKQILLNNRGQSILEALFVVAFTTVVMVVFIQICIIVTDDMIANEAAFVAMRSAVVTKSKYRLQEAESRLKNYLTFFYPALILETGNFSPSHFCFSDKETVERYFMKHNICIEDDNDEVILNNNSLGSKNRYINVWRGKKSSRDYSGRRIAKETVKVYYFTRVLFGSLTSKDNSFKNKRYQSARCRMMPSPDERYYFKSFPGANCFEK